MNSKEKGKRYEREIANHYKEKGFPAQRSQQYCGANGDADVIGLPCIHIECKHREQLNLYEAMEQAVVDAKVGEIPTVYHRKNGKKTLVTLRLEDWDKVYERAFRDEIRHALYKEAGFPHWYNRRAEDEREELYGEDEE